MFALLELDTKEQKWGETFRRRAYEAIETVIWGMRVMRVKIKVGRRKREKSIRRLLKTMTFLRATGIHTLCFENEFIYADFFLRNGFKILNTDYLYRTYGAYIAAASGREGGTAYISAERCDLVLWRTLRFLSQRCRYIYVETMQDDSDMLTAFTQQTGVSVMHPHGTAQRLEADTAIFLAPPRKVISLAQDCIVVCCGELSGKLRGGKLVTGIRFAEDDDLYKAIPTNYPLEPILSAALESGVLQGKNLHPCGIHLKNNGA